MNYLSADEIVKKIINSIEKHHKKHRKTSRFFLSFDSIKTFSGRDSLAISVINEIQNSFIENKETKWRMAWRNSTNQYDGFLLFKDNFIDTWDELK